MVRPADGPTPGYCWPPNCLGRPHPGYCGRPTALAAHTQDIMAAQLPRPPTPRILKLPAALLLLLRNKYYRAEDPHKTLYDPSAVEREVPVGACWSKCQWHWSPSTDSTTNTHNTDSGSSQNIPSTAIHSTSLRALLPYTRLAVCFWIPVPLYSSDIPTATKKKVRREYML